MTGITVQWMMCISGGLNPQEFFPRNQPTEITFSGMSLLNLGNGFGNHGLLVNARPLCGWQFGTAVGQQTDCKKRGLPHPE